MDPSRSVAYNGKLFVMGSWGLDVGLDIYDIRGSRTPYRLARHDFEDHNNGAVLIRTGKPMVTLWTRHAKDSLVRYRVGAVNVENATTRTDYLGTAEHTYTASDRTTYQVAMDINGTIWVFNRIGLARWRCVPPRRGAPRCHLGCGEAVRALHRRQADVHSSGQRRHDGPCSTTPSMVRVCRGSTTAKSTRLPVLPEDSERRWERSAPRSSQRPANGVRAASRMVNMDLRCWRQPEHP